MVPSETQLSTIISWVDLIKFLSFFTLITPFILNSNIGNCGRYPFPTGSTFIKIMFWHLIIHRACYTVCRFNLTKFLKVRSHLYVPCNDPYLFFLLFFSKFLEIENIVRHMATVTSTYHPSAPLFLAICQTIVFTLTAFLTANPIEKKHPTYGF